MRPLAAGGVEGAADADAEAEGTTTVCDDVDGVHATTTSMMTAKRCILGGPAERGAEPADASWRLRRPQTRSCSFPSGPS